MNILKRIVLVASFITVAGTPILGFAGTWHKVNDSTIKFLGSIEADEYERFIKVFDSKVDTLIVTSGGGETVAAMKIAEALLNKDYTIIVRTWCLSSCANYFFTAAKKKIIEKGIVGFHGNMNACHSADKRNATTKLIKQQTMAQGLTETQADEAVNKYFKKIDEAKKQEAHFLSKVGVSQELFDRTCTNDKGMKDGGEYSFLLPAPQTFTKYGITNILGSQDIDTIEWYPGKVVVD